MHLVHYNTGYRNVGEAKDKSDGLAVLGFMLKVNLAHFDYSILHKTLCLNMPLLTVDGGWRHVFTLFV